jgi:hypothetical protein
MFEMHALEITLDLLIKIGLFVIVLAAAWAVLKFIFKLAWRVFLFGCGAILVLGLGLLLLRFVSQ